MRKSLILSSILFSFFYGLHFSVVAETVYPTKPIEIVVGYAPGAGTDLGGRMIAEISKKLLGQDLVVINKPGGGGRLAMTLISKAKPDGYTLGAVTDSSICLSPNLEPVPYKPLEDFTFIIQFGTIESWIVVLADSPFKILKDLIEFARANPERLTVSNAGVGTGGYVALEGLSLIEGVKIKLVPFSGAAPAMTALLGGHVMASVSPTSQVAPHLQTKKVRLLAVMGGERSDDYPEVPSIKELGYPSLTYQVWYLIAGPKNMEKAIVKKLEEAFRKAMDSSDFIKLAKDLEVWTKKPLSGDDLKEALIRRSAKNEELFKKLGMGIKP